MTVKLICLLHYHDDEDNFSMYMKLNLRKLLTVMTNVVLWTVMKLWNTQMQEKTTS